MDLTFTPQERGSGIAAATSCLVPFSSPSESISRRKQKTDTQKIIAPGTEGCLCFFFNETA